MSEADSLNQDPGVSKFVESIDAIAPAPETTETAAVDSDAGWQTVDFPNAMSVDSIPPKANQQEFAIAAHPSDTAPMATPEPVARLFQELELAHQASQRQQILVETLTEQLQSSQERIAVLERECALTQQRYNEQVQLRLQAESACRDLQMRLHRQQQHTLQFKAALEKALEVSTPHKSSYLPTQVDQDEEVNSAAMPTPADNVQPVLLRNQPVKPWSAPQDNSSKFASYNEPGFKSFSKAEVVQEESTALAQPFGTKIAAPTNSNPDPVDVTNSNQDNRLNLFFPDAQGSQPHPRDNSRPSESKVLNLISFAAPDTTEIPDTTEVPDTAGVPEVLSQPEQNQPELSAASAPVAEDGIWENLEQLIDSTSVSEAASTETPEAPISEPSSGIEPISSAMAEVGRRKKLILGLTDLDRSSPENSTPSTSTEVSSSSSSLKMLSFSTAASTVAKLSVEISTGSDKALAVSQHMFPGSVGWPSPLLYPTRPAKKIPSLAAVDLPTFPRPR